MKKNLILLISFLLLISCTTYEYKPQKPNEIPATIRGSVFPGGQFYYEILHINDVGVAHDWIGSKKTKERELQISPGPVKLLGSANASFGVSGIPFSEFNFIAEPGHKYIIDGVYNAPILQVYLKDAAGPTIETKTYKITNSITTFISKSK